jgi:hypothetical protein
VREPQTKQGGSRYIGCFASEEDAARAYDCAAVQAHGPGAERNFPSEAISEPPVGLGERRRQRRSSRYIGVFWYKASSSFTRRRVNLTDPQTKRCRHIGYYASEEDAARAYDCAAVQAHGPGAERNFAGEAISEPPLSMGEQRRQRSSSRYMGVCWLKPISQSLHGPRDCGTHRPSARSTLVPSHPRRTQPGRTTMRLCKRADQGPSATFRVRRAASCL